MCVYVFLKFYVIIFRLIFIIFMKILVIMILIIFRTIVILGEDSFLE